MEKNYIQVSLTGGLFKCHVFEDVNNRDELTINSSGQLIKRKQINDIKIGRACDDIKFGEAGIVSIYRNRYNNNKIKSYYTPNKKEIF